MIEPGSADPDAASFVRALTTRQQAVLQAAVEVGCYDNPRAGTHEGGSSGTRTASPSSNCVLEAVRNFCSPS